MKSMQSFLTKEVPLEALVELQWYLNPGESNSSSFPVRCALLEPLREAPESSGC